MIKVAIIGHSLPPLSLGLCVEAMKDEGLIVIQGECEMIYCRAFMGMSADLFYLSSLIGMQRRFPTPQKQNQRKFRRDARRRAKR